ncbi:hypothetical protein GCM10012275_19540 [Longimycelium tulufanense]|uniref:Uncharacterized protein n=1 Tax=Longimycelium tulufanense TaxID=907463 RepID=A0A8J3C7C3_9PSEU|nr:hypothetical protein GCM10012275_19540 [Longimycelium tulufanense]
MGDLDINVPVAAQRGRYWPNVRGTKRTSRYTEHKLSSTGTVVRSTFPLGVNHHRTVRPAGERSTALAVPLRETDGTYFRAVADRLGWNHRFRRQTRQRRR